MHELCHSVPKLADTSANPVGEGRFRYWFDNWKMLDDRNRELAEVTNADDFIVSDKLISLVLTQFSENKQLTDVFDELFRAEGSDIYLKPASGYVAPGVPVNFFTIIEAARWRGETALGYRLAADARDGKARWS